MSIPRAASFALALAVGCQRVGPPVGQIRVYVDTDLAVPALASRLRIDVYTPTGAWTSTFDAPLERDRLPTSFTLVLSTGASAEVVLRLRAYRDGEVRPYLGERFLPRFLVGADPSASVPIPTGDGLPRLVSGDTPETEPDPLLTIDRLARVRVEADTLHHVALVLRGACAGTMARMDFSNLGTCESVEGVLEPVRISSLAAGPGTPPRSLAGTFGSDLATPCDAPPVSGDPREEEICVRGGAFILGSDNYLSANSAMPKRIARVRSFLMDKYEVSVARLRRARERQCITFADENDGPITGTLGLTSCTLTRTPGAREDYPVNCVSHDSAAAFCACEGKVLPSEAQWSSRRPPRIGPSRPAILGVTRRRRATSSSVEAST